MRRAGIITVLGASLLGAGLLGACGTESEPPPDPSPPTTIPVPTGTTAPETTGFPAAPPLPLPRPVPSTDPIRPGPGLDETDRALLSQARRSGAQWVVLLVTTAPERGADVTARLEELGGVVGTSSPGPGYLRLTMPTVNVERAAALPGITALDVEEVISPHGPRPTG